MNGMGFRRIALAQGLLDSAAVQAARRLDLDESRDAVRESRVTADAGHETVNDEILSTH